MFVHSVPIFTAGNMKEIELVVSDFQQPPYDMIGIVLDDVGTERWARATERAIGARLAGVVKGRLITLPIVNASINSGRAAFPLGVHGKHKNGGLLQVVQDESLTVAPVR